MNPDDRDAANLHDMLEVALEARELVADIRAEAFLKDRVRRRALERLLELIGEAARRITPLCQAEHDCGAGADSSQAMSRYSCPERSRTGVSPKLGLYS